MIVFLKEGINSTMDGLEKHFIKIIYNRGELIMGVITWIILGALAGWIASKIMNTNKSMGAIANIVVGIIGAMIGGFVMNFFGGVGATGLNIYSVLVAVLGSIILIAIVKAVTRK